MAAAAVTLTKKSSTTLGSQHGPTASTDLIFEVVRIKMAETTDWIECGGASPQTQMVRRPVAAFITGADLVGSTAMAATSGIFTTISGTKVLLTGGGTVENAYLWVLIVGLAT